MCSCPKMRRILLNDASPAVAIATLSFGKIWSSATGTLPGSPSLFNPTISGIPPSTLAPDSLNVRCTTPPASEVTSNSTMYASASNGITSVRDEERNPDINLSIAPSTGWTTWSTPAHFDSLPD